MKGYIFTFVTAFLMLSSACGNSSEPSKTIGATASSDKKTDGNVFSIETKLVSGRKNQFKADLNGDGIEDSIFVVDLALIGKNLPSGVKVVQPWKYYGEGAAPVGLVQGSKLGLYVQLSSAAAKNNYLIADANSPSVLDTEAAIELEPKKLAVVEPEDAKQLKKHARGDLIVIPTEAGIDTFLYWSGDKFVVYEPANEP